MIWGLARKRAGPFLCDKVKRQKKESDSKKRSQTHLGCLDYVFSNSFLEDLERLWELRSIIPDPCNPNIVVNEKTEGIE